MTHTILDDIAVRVESGTSKPLGFVIICQDGHTANLSYEATQSAVDQFNRMKIEWQNERRAREAAEIAGWFETLAKAERSHAGEAALRITEESLAPHGYGSHAYGCGRYGD